ncbi:hypothetical protein F4813DRAFT_261661 [Daldinia decipiens]|uniref:uncharacterized protein n=1 Tax=Daldinia decipiens TaxID=326647 RepID=UPI0020C44FA5|nr:uncharacterized protein F4813DRAFT_261661 [Daldinia decipiens]KAI1660708.1 hypothetical protein F4813DRAFT_261661 [Daldinia decipiens]
MPTVSQEYLPFVVLAFVLLSIRLDRISIRNFISVTIGAVTVWIISPPHSPWGKTISFIILGLAIAMSPLRSFLVRTVKNMLLNTPQYVPEGPLLTILKDPSDAEVDIVAVHGLGSSVETTWTHKISGSLWLRDFLHLDFPKARVMTFRHNSSWESRALVKDLVDHGRQFLGALEGLRAIDESRDRPLILVGHSFGGLLIEQALVLAKGAAANANTRACHESLTNSLAGVIFLGTPHAGSGYSFWGKLYCLFHYWEGANPLLLGYMDPGSQETTKLEDDFLKYFRDLSFDFHELRSNVIFGIQFEMIVKREAATRRGQEARGLDTDHFGLNKYYDRGDASYIAVKDKMVEMLQSWTEDMERKRNDLGRHERVRFAQKP